MESSKRRRALLLVGSVALSSCVLPRLGTHSESDGGTDGTDGGNSGAGTRAGGSGGEGEAGRKYGGGTSGETGGAGPNGGGGASGRHQDGRGAGTAGLLGTAGHAQGGGTGDAGTGGSARAGAGGSAGAKEGSAGAGASANFAAAAGSGSEHTGGSSGDGGTSGGEGGTSEPCNGCLVDGTCHEHGAANGFCQVCDAAASADSWTPTHEGEPCDEGRTCVSGVCSCSPFWRGPDCETCVVHVSKNGDDAVAGGSWSTALVTVQAGVDLAAARVTQQFAAACEVWVAEGTYAPKPEDGRAATLQLSPDVRVLGGFSGTETLREQRDFAAHQTVLSGDALGDDVAGNFAEFRTDNLYHVVTGAGDAVLDGFTISGGMADGTDAQSKGAGLYTASGSLTVQDCVFRDNSATDRGGGAYTMGTLSIADTAFEGNAAHLGGGALVDYPGSLVVFRSRFTANQAREFGGAICAWQSHLQARQSVFDGNSSGTQGGALYNDAYSSSEVTNCVFRDNSAGTDGGAIFNYEVSEPVITSSLFWNNSASGDGGGILCDIGANARIVNSTFVGNGAGNAGGGLFEWPDDTTQVANSIFWNNSAPSGGSNIYARGGEEFATLTVTYSAVQGGCIVGACTTDATGNIADAPDFVDALHGDFRLKAESPCIDRGNNAAVPGDGHDLDGRARSVDGDRDETATVDMGAYEYDPAAP